MSNARKPPEQPTGVQNNTSPDPTKDMPVFDVQHLFKGARCVVLSHDGERYVLRLTSNNKLILTK
ncbi:MAG: hemin uptake protein HemP [Beijerinckiaceae bacterium]